MKVFSRDQRLTLGAIEKEVRVMYEELLGRLTPEKRMQNLAHMGKFLELLDRWVRTFVSIANGLEPRGKTISGDDARILLASAGVALGVGMALRLETDEFMDGARPADDHSEYVPLFEDQKEKTLH